MLSDIPSNPDSPQPSSVLISLGELSPWGKFPKRRGGAAGLEWGNPVPIMVHQLPVDATEAELTACKLGRIDVGFHLQETTVFLTWKFSSSRHSLVVETPLHLGLEPEENRGVPIEDGCLSMVQATQDSNGICMCIRPMKFGERLTKHINDALVLQMAECRDPNVVARHSRSVERWNQRYDTAALAHRNSIFHSRVA